jgi:dCTP deaminase
MAALSRSALFRELADKRLRVSPILSDEQIGASSIDLRMGTVVLMARAGRQSHVDPVAYGQHDTHQGVESKQQKHEKFVTPFHQSFLLHPGALALVPTLEWVKLPFTLQGVVTARSSWAREGLNIATATMINPGYRGIITLELANFGEIPIKLSPGLRIAQLALYTLAQADPARDAAALKRSHFDLAFEPEAGNIAKLDGNFIR